MDLETMPSSESPGMDCFLANFMIPDLPFDSEKSELKHLRSAQSVLRDEILTAYEFMNEEGILQSYKAYRGL